MVFIYIALAFFILSASIFVLVASYWLYIECKINKIDTDMFNTTKTR